MEIRAVLQSQHLAALAMLKEAVEKCPPEIWDNANDQYKFWSTA